MDPPVRSAHPHRHPHLPVVAVCGHILHRGHVVLLLCGLCLRVAGTVRKSCLLDGFGKQFEKVQCDKYSKGINTWIANSSGVKYQGSRQEKELASSLTQCVKSQSHNTTTKNQPKK